MVKALESPYANSIISRELVIGDNGYPVKLYDFKSSQEVFSGPIEVKEELLRKINVVKHPSLSPGNYNFSIACAWGYKEDSKPVKAFDIFSYRGFDKQWNQCNPDIDIYNIKNDATSMGNICETGAIVLAAEGNTRRKTNNLEEFLKIWPDIGELGR